MIEKKENIQKQNDHRLFNYQLNQIFSEVDSNSTADVSFLQDIYENSYRTEVPSLVGGKTALVLKTSPLFYKKGGVVSENDTECLSDDSFFIISERSSAKTKRHRHKKGQCKCM